MEYGNWERKGGRWGFGLAFVKSSGTRYHVSTVVFRR